MRARVISKITLALALLAVTILAASPDLVTTASALVESPTPGSLLANGSLERGVYSPTNNPTAWERRRAESGTGSVFTWEDAVAHSGSKSAKITSPTPSYGAWVQTLTVQPETVYILSGWIKTENLIGVGALSTSGANLSIPEASTRSQARFGTTGWTYVGFRFNSGQNSQVTVAAQAGDPSGFVIGAAWFAALSASYGSTRSRPTRTTWCYTHPRRL